MHTKPNMNYLHTLNVHLNFRKSYTGWSRQELLSKKVELSLMTA